MNLADEPLAEAELEAIEARSKTASPAPWRSFVEGRDHWGGDDFIRVSDSDDEPDMYVSRDGKPADAKDLDFIAHARQDIPRLIAEVRRLRQSFAVMRITYDREADAAYIYLTDDALMPGRDSVPVDPPEGQHAFVVLDWKDGRIVGLEVLDASKLLHADLLAEAETYGDA